MPKKAKPRNPENRQPEPLEVTIRGPEDAVRRALEDVRFAGVWHQGIARRIALHATGVEDADLDDALGGPKIALFSPESRQNYRDQCCAEAARKGHPVDDPSKVECEEDTTIMTVGDTLFDNARP
jgi:hypothetical protein